MLAHAQTGAACSSSVNYRGRLVNTESEDTFCPRRFAHSVVPTETHNGREHILELGDFPLHLRTQIQGFACSLIVKLVFCLLARRAPTKHTNQNGATSVIVKHESSIH